MLNVPVRVTVRLPGIESKPCECPTGYRRYGSRCLTLLEPQPYAIDICYKVGGDLAVPRSADEWEQIQLAAVQLQTEPLAKIWVGAYQYDVIDNVLVYKGWDNCGPIVLDSFWAAGQPTGTGDVFYAPPGVPDVAPGWYIETNWRAVSYRPLCQLQACYRPDCVV